MLRLQVTGDASKRAGRKQERLLRPDVALCCDWKQTKVVDPGEALDVPDILQPKADKTRTKATDDGWEEDYTYST